MCWQIATVECVFVFDILSLGDAAFDAGLRAVMQSVTLQKVCSVALSCRYVTSCLGQLSLTIPPWIGAVSRALVMVATRGLVAK